MSTVQETTILDKIRTRGFWRVVIRPTTFQERLVPNFGDLWPIIEKNSVQLRGWDYPHIDYSQPPLRGKDWVGQEYDRGDKIEVWRIHQSGLFAHFFTIAGDWRDHSDFWPPEPEWVSGREIYYLSSIHSFVEIYEFASRLALSPAGAGHMSVEIDVEGLKGRYLTSTDRSLFGGSRNYQTQAAAWEHRWQGTQTDLIARPRELAALATQDFFARFGLDGSSETLLRNYQEMAR